MARRTGNSAKGTRHRVAKRGKQDVCDLSLCMIVRDSSETLNDCLASIKPWVDEMVIVDTGSRDNTREIAEGFGARVFEFPWCDDFSAARNESLRHARGQWIFWMDADDTISPLNGQKLRQFPQDTRSDGSLGFIVQVHCPGDGRDGVPSMTVVDHVKLFRNHPEIRFEGRIHEQVLPAIRRLNGSIGWTDIFVTHSGSNQSPEGRQAKYERDLRLLQLELDERPDHPFVLFNLGMTYADMDDSASALRYLERCVEVSQPTESHVRKAYALLVGAYAQQERFDEALNACNRGRQFFPRDPELLFRLGICQHHFGRLDKAVEAYTQAISPSEDRYLSSIDAGIVGFKARHNLALVYLDQGGPDLAEMEWRRVLDEQPQFRPGWRALIGLLLQQGRASTAEVEVERMQGFDGLRIEAAILEMTVRQHQGCTDEARERLTSLPRAQSGDLELLRFRCRFLFEHGSAAESLSALSELCERTPSDGAAHHNLGMVYLKLGCLAMARAAFQKSLTVRPDYAATQQMLRECIKALEGRTRSEGLETSQANGSKTASSRETKCDDPARAVIGDVTR